MCKLYSYIEIKCGGLDMVAHTFNFRTWETEEASGSLGVPGHPELHNETLSLFKKQNKKVTNQILFF